MRTFICTTVLTIAAAFAASSAFAGPSFGQPVFGEQARQAFRDREAEPYALTGHEADVEWVMQQSWFTGGSRGQRMQWVRTVAD